MQHLLTSVRLVIVTMLICSVGYTAVVWAVANAARPWSAQGSLLTGDGGEIIGSAQIAQAFTRPEYLWPRPSAVNHDASATGGSNLSPANPALVERLAPLLASFEAGPDRPLPADLATASGSGMDPHITLEAALFQALRIARARGLSVESLAGWLEQRAERPGGILGDIRIINVLETNIALDRGEVR